MLKGLDEQIASISAPIRDELRLVEDRLRGLAQTERPYLEPLLDYVMTNGGKRLRPAITLLAAGSASWRANVQTRGCGACVQR